MCCLVLQSSCALLLTFQFALLFLYFYIFLFFSATILSGPYLWNHYSQRLQIECAAWSCSLILHCCLPSNSLRYFFFFFFPPRFFGGGNFFFFFFFFFLHFFVLPRFFFSQIFFFADFFLQIFFFFFFFSPATISSGPFASLISSLINIISLLLTTFDWTKVRGIAPRSHTGRPRTCLVFLWFYKINFFFFYVS